MSNDKIIWDKLIFAGLTPAGAAGLMGNLYAESGLNPTNLQNTCEAKLGFTDAGYTAAVDNGRYANFSNDGAGCGLGQWSCPTRKNVLLIGLADDLLAELQIRVDSLDAIEFADLHRAENMIESIQAVSRPVPVLERSFLQSRRNDVTAKVVF